MAKSKSTGFISKYDCHLFGEGTHYEIYKKLGAHTTSIKGVDGFYFAVWAPHATAVSVVGDFNNWETSSHRCSSIDTSGIWEIFIPSSTGITLGQCYKFAITTGKGDIIYKADPYARSAQFRPETASVLCDEPWDYVWSDDEWMKSRAEKNLRHEAMSIYECHLGSWKKSGRPKKDGFYTYKELAIRLASYVKHMGYTHVELIGIAEYPFDASWGYQVTGYFAPTSRYGSPDEFQYFVDYMHANGIGVILDWVPAHFPKDAFGLADFDGQPVYEYADPRKGEHPDWNTKVFDFEKHEVTNFLISNALYWLNEYHIDGLRVDAVASILYLDYGRRGGQWIPNKYGENKNLEAIEFFKHLNSVIAGRGDGTITIAEESTAWPMVTHRPEDGGLGFTFKWNMGWMHDFLEYMSLDPYFRKDNHSKMTFTMTYATSENFILVLSHDEVVHLKRTLIEKMPGTNEDRFKNLKCGYAFMIGHPGKKLLFMGQDFAQYHEWDEKVSLNWELCDEPLNADMQKFYRSLLFLYRNHPSLYELDDKWEGFSWINANDYFRSIFSWIRYSEDQKDTLIFIINFTPVDRDDYMVGVPNAGRYRLVLDETVGSYDLTRTKKPIYKSEKGECDGREHHIKMPLKGYGIAVLEYVQPRRSHELRV